MIFKHVFNTRKTWTKRITKFDGLEPRRCEDVKLIVAPEMEPKSYGTFEKQTPALSCSASERELKTRSFSPLSFSRSAANHILNQNVARAAGENVIIS